MAELIDATVIFAIATPLRVAVGLHAFGGGSAGDNLADLGVLALVALLYMPTIMRITDGRTAGKMVMSLVVVRVDEEPMSFRLAAVREVLLKQLSFGLAILAAVAGSNLEAVALVDYLWPLWDGENRALHDMVVETRVVVYRGT